MEEYICPICGEPITNDDYYVDDSNNYGGICHVTCYEEAEEDRLKIEN